MAFASQVRLQVEGKSGASPSHFIRVFQHRPRHFPAGPSIRAAF